MRKCSREVIKTFTVVYQVTQLQSIHAWVPVLMEESTVLVVAEVHVL